jgi:hypothetical protein
MLSRLFSRPSNQPTNAGQSEPLLGAAENAGSVRNIARSNSRCNLSSFWIGSEFVYNFAKVLSLSTYALATQITDIARMPSDFDTIELSKTALYISIPVAVLFAASEAACHYAESQLISSNNEDAVAANDVVDETPEPLRPWQIILIALHLMSDVYADAGSYLAIAEIIGLKQQAEAVRYGLYAGLTFAGLWGNTQEARNAVESFKEMNANARRMNGNAV